MAETLHPDVIINDLEAQFGPVPEHLEQGLTMLDLLGVECTPAVGTEVPQAVTASAITDKITGDGDGF